MLKRNRIEISVKGLILAVVVIVALIICSAALFIVNEAQSAVNGSSNQFSKMVGQYAEDESVLYDNTVITGDKVVEVINDVCGNDKEISVTVVTNMNTQTPSGQNGMITTDAKTYSKATNNSKAVVIRLDNSECSITPSGEGYRLAGNSDRTNKDYINPMAAFRGTVHKNENGMVDNILFIQQ